MAKKKDEAPKAVAEEQTTESPEQKNDMLQIIPTADDLQVFGTPVTDTLGNTALVHQSRVPESEGGPYVWLTLQKQGETEAYAVHLGQEETRALRDRLTLALDNLWADK